MGMTVVSLLSGVYYSILTAGPGCGYDFAQPAVWGLLFNPNCMDPQVPGLVNKHSSEGILCDWLFSANRCFLDLGLAFLFLSTHTRFISPG